MRLAPTPHRPIRIFYALAALALIAGARPASAVGPEPPHCVLESADSAWLHQSIELWRWVRTRELELEAGTPPRVELFDATCRWSVKNRASSVSSGTEPTMLDVGEWSLEVVGAPHGDRWTLPDGSVMTPRIASFTSISHADGAPFVLLAMPDVWLAEQRHRHDVLVDMRIRSVLVHEMARASLLALHDARRAALLSNPATGFPSGIDPFDAREANGNELHDSVRRERDAYLKAAEESDGTRRRVLLGEAVALSAGRAAHGLAESAEEGVALDEAFLTIEGVAAWSAYRAIVRHGMADLDGIYLTRSRWPGLAHDLGFAMVRAAQASGIDWRPALLGPEPGSLPALLRSSF